MARWEPLIPPQCDIMIPVTVTFYGDVGFDRSYNHVIDFSNESERDAYFSPRILKTVQNCAYNKPMNSIQLKCSYTEALNFTYCKFIIGSNVNSQKKIYAWVDDVVLITDQKDDNNVFIPIIQINISIDPWQTFLFDFTLGESFVAREHVDRFKLNGDGSRGWCLDNSSGNDNVGAYKRLTELCNLSQTYTFTINGTSYTTKIIWLVLQKVVTDSGYGLSQTEIIFIPVTPTSTTIKWRGDTSNLAFHIITLEDVIEGTFLQFLGVDPETVANVSFIPFDIGVPFVDNNGILDFNFYFRNEPRTPTGNEFTRIGMRDTNLSNIEHMAYSYKAGAVGKTIELNRDVTFSGIDFTVPSNNDVYSRTHEPQLYKEPFYKIVVIDEQEIERGVLPSFSANVINGFKGVRLKLLLDTVEVKLRIVPLYVIENPNIVLSDRLWIEYSLNRVDVLKSNWMSYLLQERETARQMISSQINQQAIASAIGGVSSSVGMGGQQAMSVRKAQASGSQAASMLSEGGAFGAGALVGLGVSAIQTVGGYIANKHFAFEQQDIREKAVRMKANNVLLNGTFKSSVNLSIKFCVVRCDETTINLKSLEFHKYGYSVYFYETPNTKSRKYFNYIATNIVKIEGSLNNDIKMSLMEIFNNGVTIWHGDYISELTGIGDYSKENIERSLI